VQGKVLRQESGVWIVRFNVRLNVVRNLIISTALEDMVTVFEIFVDTGTTDQFFGATWKAHFLIKDSPI
jgi:hypothetical protein